MTQSQTPAPENAAGHGYTPGQAAHDPMNDIDGPKTTYAVVGTLVFIVFLMWIMSHLYNVMVQVNLQEKIGDIPTTELNNIRAEQMDELNGKNPKRGKLTIDQAIDAYLK